MLRYFFSLFLFLGLCLKASTTTLAQDTLSIDAQFPGGQVALNKWLDEHFEIPESQRNSKIEGTLKAKLRISANGKVDTQITMLHEINTALATAFVASLKLLPPFLPAKYQGQAIASEYILSYKININAALNSFSTEGASNPDTNTTWQIKANRPKYDSVIIVPGIGEVVLSPINYLDKPLIFKTALTGLWYGYLPLYLDIKIKKKLSFEIGSGMSFRSLNYDLFHYLFNGAQGTRQNLGTWQNQSNTRDEPDDYTNYSYRYATPGYYLSATLKKYTWGNGLKGLYFAPRVEFMEHRFKYRMVNNNQKRDANLLGNESIRLIKPMMCVGYQGFRKSVVKEMVLSAGLTIEQSSREDLGFDLLTNNYINGQLKRQAFYPSFKLDVRFGSAVGKPLRTYATRYKVGKMLQPKIFDEQHPNTRNKNPKFKNL